jgi:ADP-ribose pyrophosphatase YjhB (NUDIX family)
MLSKDLLERAKTPVTLYVDTLPARITQEKGIEFLVFKRLHSVVMPDVWQPACGKLGVGESIRDAFHSQIRKKCNLDVQEIIPIDHITTYYDHYYDVVMIVPCAGVLVSDGNPEVDSSLHSEYRWINLSDIPLYIKFEGQLTAYNKLHNTLSTRL